ncbi:M1 family metallopeptidase [Actinomadura terrae]|uniref:M1 family metallopeptidase n=1 Tax=Actinomadura terrae TaxID=604353 RepID=UPI001FA72D74|nr:M1 family metallopeptidase [Actinomadura terrae]
MRTGRGTAVVAGAVVAVTTIALAGPVAAGTRARGEFGPGAPGLGDPWYPQAGNGGYQVGHYDLDLSYEPRTRHLEGRVRIRAEATQNLSRFDLDFRGLSVRRVAVNGRPAGFNRDGQELRITPARGLPDRSRFTVTVDYGGTVRPEQDAGGPTGFVPTPDGAVVSGGGDTASTWFPSNDHPSDKATFDFRVRVPAGLRVVANGEPRGRRDSGATTTYEWSEPVPMATYLATVDIGRWQVRRGRTPGGIPEYVAIDPALRKPARPMEFFWNTTARVVDVWSSRFGPYPFGSTGAIAIAATYEGEPVPISEETQTRPVYSLAEGDQLVAHELAHQWFGDCVGVTAWNEIWLSEGFSTFAAWYWDEINGRGRAHDEALKIYNGNPSGARFWTVPIADVPKPDPDDPEQVSGSRAYLGGAMALQFLREKLGDETFFAVLRAWPRRHRYGTATTAQFAALASEISGRDLRGFFATWVQSPGKPALPRG